MIAAVFWMAAGAVAVVCLLAIYGLWLGYSAMLREDADRHHADHHQARKCLCHRREKA